MVSYGTHQANYGKNYAFVSYGTDNSSYSVKTSSWKKSTCCNAFKFGSRCSDCPSN